MYIILDIIVVLILGLTVYTVTKRGFVKTVFDFGSLIAAIIISKIFSPALSEFFYDSLYSRISTAIGNGLRSLLDTGGLPDNLEIESLTALFEKYNIELKEIIPNDSTEATVQFIAQNIVSLLAYALSFILIFIVSLVALKIIALLIDGVFKLPVLKTINKGLGFVLGIISAAIYVLLFVALMQLAVPYLGSVYPEVFSQGAIDNTFVFRYLYNFEWVQFLVN